ncbi:hypothetical protein B0A50_07197 [Salinomyces thailandicus]|uniref:E3 ubiquitin-protein ligase n=1 Tax=Salinomyces thailandicus TaxID=706561 RepID=A0A4U0TMQ4_9PEZI|nr:hypothetical protein B0A50_07197 [Salinomyces thailandica]
MATDQATALATALCNLPAAHSNRFTPAALAALHSLLFHNLAANSPTYLRLLFPSGPPPTNPTDPQPWSLKDSQNLSTDSAISGPEYSAAARGTACGHIFRAGESTYSCKTCAVDETCVLCARCYEGSEHEGHRVFVSVSPGNSGCCDCGDAEAWKREVRCSIHGVGAGRPEDEVAGKGKGKEKESELPEDLVEGIRVTVARVLDYLCDVFSCAPEQLRLPKSRASIEADERNARLGGIYGSEPSEEEPEYALLLWNDEKHTVDDVQNQVARACAKSKRFGLTKAMEVNDIGRSVVHYSRDVKELLAMAALIEQIKVTVTIRSARDTFREQMCAAMVEWVQDICGCTVGNDAYVLRNVVCEELLHPWRVSRRGGDSGVGRDGLDDHEMEDNEKHRRQYRTFMQPFANAQTVGVPAAGVVRVEIARDEEDVMGHLDDDDDDDDDEDDEDEDEEGVEDDEMEDVEESEEGLMEIDIQDLRDAATNAAMAARHQHDQEQEAVATGSAAADMEVDFMDDHDDVTEALEATIAGYPPPPPPPPHPQQQHEQSRRQRIFTPAESESDADQPPSTSGPFAPIPPTPRPSSAAPRKSTRPPKHWLDPPPPTTPPSSPLRLDILLLTDLRLWKTLRTNLRTLYITTLIPPPKFKPLLGLRYAALYPCLAQLYLIADREPDHSIVNLSVQLLTTPSVTTLVVHQVNFLSNLLAIIYTFLTTRQVSYPPSISRFGTLSFTSGAVSNRRIFHFFLDLRWLLANPSIQALVRAQRSQSYLLQITDLAKLLQGVCPNVRKVGEHVEFEGEVWISASMIVKEIDRICRLVGDAFELTGNGGRQEPESPEGEGVEERSEALKRAMRTVGRIAVVHALGFERARFAQAEVRRLMAWHYAGLGGVDFPVPNFVVLSEPMSFHHPLHYLLSWLLEHARGMTRAEVREVLEFSPEDLRPEAGGVGRAGALGNTASADQNSEEFLSGLFEHPLRTCVWLSQMKAGLWVRNGITLRHQAHTYKSVSHRDLAYQRDLHLLQTALVLTGGPREKPGERFLAQLVNRFALTAWMAGDYRLAPSSGIEEAQHIDMLEDLYHLLITLLTDRDHLHPTPTPAQKALRDRRTVHRELLHALAFKPLSFSDLTARVPEKIAESDVMHDVLASITTYRAPEGLNDTGTFELKPECVGELDPYFPFFTRNQREEAEGILKGWEARRRGVGVESVVVEPKVTNMEVAGLFQGLGGVTVTGGFVQIVCAGLGFAATRRGGRTETFLGVVLYLILVAVVGEDVVEGGDVEEVSGAGFARLAVEPMAKLQGLSAGQPQSVVGLLVTLAGIEEYTACHPTIKCILRKMQARQPERLYAALDGSLTALLDGAETGSPASMALTAEDERERKKTEARERQARVMARMKEQQESFLANQGLSAFGDELEDLDDEDEDAERVDDDMMSITDEPESLTEKRKTWSFPSGTCILCQEETGDGRLFGTFAFLGESGIVRSSPVRDPDFVREVVETPKNLDRNVAEGVRPFGVAGRNKEMVQKTTAEGQTIAVERHGLSRGFPHQHAHDGFKGPVSTSCGHIMHYGCFELYAAATQRRHAQQIARNHPERLECKEFICPLCKALGNAFLPIIWKAKACAYEHELHAAKRFDDWLDEAPKRYMAEVAGVLPESDFGIAPAAGLQRRQQVQEQWSARSSAYVQSMFLPPLVASMQELSLERQGLLGSGMRGQGSSSSSSSSSSQRRYSLRRGYSLSTLFRLGGSGPADGGAGLSSQSPVDQPPPRMAELVKAYHRLDETIRANRLCTVGKLPSYPTMPPSSFADPASGLILWDFYRLQIALHNLDRELTSDLRTAQIEGVSAINPVVPLARALGISVSAFEIAHRGSGDAAATSLLAVLTEQNLTHLRILSETMESFLAVNVLRNPGSNPIGRETARKRDIMVAQLFGLESETAMMRLRESGWKFLFQDDVFLFFADWLGFMAPDVAEASEILQLCYWAEIVKTVIVYKTISKAVDVDFGDLAEEDVRQQPVSEAFRLAVNGLALDDTRFAFNEPPFSERQTRTLRSIIEKYATVFLRKAIVLMHVRYGLEFECPYNIDVTAPELDRLSALLHMPSLDQLVTLYTSEGSGSDALRALTNRWVSQAKIITDQEPVDRRTINMPHPAIFELIGLPKNYDTLTQEAMKRKCPTTGKEVTDPAICLFCAAIFCSQAVCCMKDRNKGGCYQHMQTCGSSIGIFLNIRKCMVLFMHGGNGSWAHAPYLDQHGETDPTLRRHQQLYLNQKRYDKLYREAWLGHLVPTVISRKLEGDVNPGGWETL